MTSALPFEGPEKKLLITFTSKSPGLRAMSSRDLNRILSAASCSALSVIRNEKMDAYLLSESSLFVSHSSFMIKTCGSTTLLLALPVLLDVAARLGQFPAFVQYSRVEFSFPDRQPFPHNTYANEVAYLDSVLRFSGRPFQLGSSQGITDWYLYVAQLLPGADFVPPQTLEIFMFNLSPITMKHFLNEESLTRGGSKPAVQQTTMNSGIQKLLKENSDVDAYNFLPCGYSLNAIRSNEYYTIHVSPEPEASYVSFETTVNTQDTGALVADVIDVFRPGRFTVAFLSGPESGLVSQNSGTFEHFGGVPKRISSHLYSASDSTSVRVSNLNWTTVRTYTHLDYRPSTISLQPVPLLPDVIESHTESVMDELVSRFGNVHYVPSADALVRARAIAARMADVKHPTFVIDLDELYRRSLHVQNHVYSQFKTRYAVRCNSDPAVLRLLGLLGWSFEAVSLAEVDSLYGAGVTRGKIAFVSPLITANVMTRLPDIGVIALFDIPSEKLQKAIKESGVCVEVRVPQGAVEQTVAICKQVLTFQTDIHSLALKEEAALHLLDPDDIQACLGEGLNTLQKVFNSLPPSAVENTIVCIGELFPSYRETDLDASGLQLKKVCEAFPNICFDPGRWVLRNCSSLVVRVIGRRVRGSPGSLDNETPAQEEEARAECYNYFLNDGVYGAFSFVAMERSAISNAMEALCSPQVIAQVEREASPKASILSENSSVESSDDECIAHSVPEKRFTSTLFGPTCDALDRIWTGQLPKLDIGDLLLFREMGAYSSSAVSFFNGFAKKFDTVYVLGHHGTSCGPLE